MVEQVSQQVNSLALNTSLLGESSKRLVIASTFTAEPVQESLEFWLAQLGLDFAVEFADYNQVFQQLLNPISLMAQNQEGINLLLIRIEDWIRFLTASEETAESSTHGLQEEGPATVLDRSAQDFIDAVGKAAQTTSTPYVIAFCPPSVGLSVERLALYQRLEQTITAALTSIQSVYLMPSADIFSRYPVRGYYDESRDRIGHIPYTDVAFTALGTALARMIYALKRSPHKVIALDCDRTLWQGICGEDGPMGVSVNGPFKALQSFMVRCSQAGLLLCLCSKNVEEDVWQVFDQRDDMPLSRDRIVAWRINWEPKSENLRSLAQELNLGLDSFIFIDDNPVECSEVQARCPEVLTLQLPDDPEQIPEFLNHVWPFDTLRVTDADKNRTQLYKQNTERSRFERDAIDFNAFIEGLQLDIQITPPSSEQMARVAQLTQRTNQFNATTRRRNESEIQQLCQAQGYGCRVVTVKDRFGDYGLVGVMLFQPQGDTLDVDTFLLSCRVLGRGVEHKMATHLGAIAAENNLSTVTLNYYPTPKNLPIANFFKGIGEAYQSTGPDGSQYALPTEVAQSLTFTASAPPMSAKPQPKQADSQSAEQAAPMQTSPSVRWSRIARELQQPNQILAAIVDQTRRQTQTLDWVAPQSDIEKTLAKIWADALRLDRVGLHDNFFNLGGTSLLAVSVFTGIEAAFGKRLPMTILLEAPTLEKLAAVIAQDGDQNNDVWSPLVTVRAEGAKAPLYLVHGGYGDVLGISRIVQYFSSDQPLYALRGIGLDGEQLPLGTVDAMAVEYVKAIKQNRPEGPYQIAGQCSGGILAFEIAQQLLAQGDEVSFLGLFDTPHPRLEKHFTNRARYYFHKPTYRHSRWDKSYYLFTSLYYKRRLTVMLKYHWRELRKRNFSGRLQYFAPYVDKLNQRLLSKVGIKATPPAQTTPQAPPKPSTPEKTPSLASQPVSALEAPALSPSLDAQQTLIKDRFFEVFLRAQKAYEPKPYKGQIDFFLTLQHSYVPKKRPFWNLSVLNTNPRPVDDISQLLFGWDQLVANNQFHIHPVDSTHGEMLEDPYIERLAKAVQAVMEARPNCIERPTEQPQGDLSLINS